MEDIVKSLATRYEAKLDNSPHSDRLRHMLIAMVENVNAWPIDKINRWIGFVQGVLWEKGLIDIDEEREFTRPLFHSYYESHGIEKPTPLDVASPEATLVYKWTVDAEDCPKCEVKPGEHCHSNSRKIVYPPHMKRYEQWVLNGRK